VSVDVGSIPYIVRSAIYYFFILFLYLYAIFSIVAMQKLL
jgi:hypothetical protein